jgi:2-dehydro-3-deoxygalactonokinase
LAGGAPAERAERFRAALTAGLNALSSQPVGDLRGAPVVVSGMAGSTIGWHELAYARLPLSLDGSGLAWHELEAIESNLGRHRVMLVSGAASDSDVMRGEETELVGLFTLPLPEGLASRAVVMKPGTHSKHLRVTDGRLVGLQTFMTGELYDLLRRHSVLQHSLADDAAEPAWGPQASENLRAGVRHARALPLSAALFRVRTRQVLDRRDGADNRAFLVGVLLANELAYLASGGGEEPLVLCATGRHEAPYRLAIDELRLADRLLVIPAADVELLSARGQAALGRTLGWF